MEGNNSSLGLETVLRLRVPGELKAGLAAAAKRRRQRPSQFVRNVLWEIVDKEERATFKQAEATQAAPVETVKVS